MRPVSFDAASPASRGAIPDGRASSGSDEDLAATVSFSDSDDDMPDPPALQQLAQALLDWEPALLAPYARLNHAPEDVAPFAAFLVRLKGDAAGQAALGGEIVGWLQTLAADDPARRRAFRTAATAHAVGTALQTYRAIRTASQ